MFEASQSIARQGRLESERGNFDRMWQEAAELFLPRQADFLNTRRTQGEDRSNLIFDEYGTQALDDGTSVFEGFVMPRGSIWQMIVAPEDALELMKLQHVRAWYERKTRRLFALRNDPMSGFVQQTNESSASLLAFGNQGMTVDLRFDPVTRRPSGLRYRSEHIGSLWIEEDWQGLPARKHRKFCWSAEQARQFWGDAKLERAPEVLNAATDDKKKHDKFEFLHVIEPNYFPDSDRLDWRGKPYFGGYISISDKEFIEQGGYRATPLTYSRFAQSPTETYGRGPGINVLPAIKAAQQIMLDLMVGAEMSLMPPLAASEDMLDQQILYAARDITYGAIDARGNPTVQRLFDVGDMGGALSIQEMVHKVIDHAFFRDLLFITKEMKSHVTDAQLYERTQEKGILLAPLSRQETEWFSPMLEREIDLMAQMGDFDDMPYEVREAGGLKHVVYDNPLNRAQRAEQAGGYFRTLGQLAPLMQVDPNAAKIFLREYPLEKVIRGLAEINAVPASWAATDAERKAAANAEASAEQAQMLLQALPAVGKAANDLSQASSNVA